MITFRNTLAKKERFTLTSLMADLVDAYGDFYLTKDNLRLFIKENQDILYEGLSKGDKIAFYENGLAVVVGFSDNAPRKYIKILAKDDASAESLLKILFWNTDCDLYAKVKKTNPLKNVLERNGFYFLGGRGKEILLKRDGGKKDAKRPEK